MENLFTYSPGQHAAVALLFSGAFAAALAGLGWFLMNLPKISPRWRPITYLSILVMLVAGWHFLQLSNSWRGAFVFEGTIGDGGMWVPGDRTFENGFRYISWLITIPLLLVQLTYLFELSRERLYRLRLSLVVMGVAMIVTGYIGQLYEVTSTSALLVWGAVSTVPFVVLVLLLMRHLGPTLQALPAKAATTLRNITYLFAATWGAYPVAYLMALGDGPEWVVGRQLLFTFADVGSKVVYGVLLASIARRLSARDGWPAAADDPWLEGPVADG
ncbi:bacteriorhodopsin [Euzebya tangerina]|uniref:bacteriorhodopsin n=1 Tax=Euzebya tangerina TaxID=591198 RepID=UPI000E312DAB|nr:bacteriorhodopsin [Euzebya tangerina]